MFFAISAANARKVKGENVTPMVCMVEAIGTTAWRTQTPKIWVPHDKVAKLIGGKNNIAKLKEQEALATCAGYKPSETVRFSPREYRYSRSSGSRSNKPHYINAQSILPTLPPAGLQNPGISSPFLLPSLTRSSTYRLHFERKTTT